jgi:ribosomal protein S18 acetylase RimI-like enzyme
MLPHNITIATLKDMALLENHMLTGGMPDTHRRRFLLQAQGKGLYLLAWEDQVPIGYVLLHFQHPGHHASYRHYPECAYVEGLATHPDKQRRGIATSLMKSTEYYARQHGAENIGLSVGMDNAPAQDLYRKMAYQPTNILPYQVTWKYLDKITGEVREEGELCRFWIKPLD